MIIDEAKQAQAALDAALVEALNAFSVKTGLTVSRLEAKAVMRLGASTKYIVTTEVKL